jgi:5S rRNA maturation endonuclease (ribonuclease M5)
VVILVLPDVDIDSVINYETEYYKYLKKPKKAGSQLTALCPFHDDKNASFSVNLTTGKYSCFACGESGNFITFYAHQHNMSTEQAYKEICDRFNIIENSKPKKPSKKAEKSKSLTVTEYALQKSIPLDWLEEMCRLETGKDRDGTQFLKEPYFDEDLQLVTYRKRYADKEFRWKKGSAGNIIMYGEWRMPAIQNANYAIFVEGESDTQTLWYLGFSALGIAGANLFKEEFVKKLQDIKLYIHVEPDQGGQTFFRKMCEKLHSGNFPGKVFQWSCNRFQVKDPSELYMTYGKDEATKLIKQAISEAEEVDINDVKETIPKSIDDAPIALKYPDGWFFDDTGIYKDTENGRKLVCRTPIIITKRLQSLKQYSEKIEIAFKRDKAWRTAIYNRSTIFQSKNITVLADLGCTITSENAKMVVSFLQSLEAANMDVITKCSTTSTFGWQNEKHFIPGTENENIILDIEPSLQSWAEAFEVKGDLQSWIDIMQPYRNRNKFRFILATAFAAPLLRIVKQRTFTVYNWGNSKGGKTATLKAALSAWGNPERLMVNFNITQVALEHMAEFFSDLPLGIDERQLAGNNNQNQIEKFIYMLSSEIGKGRGSKMGGLQQISKWKTIALMTGEEPISVDTTQTGVSSRTVEIYGGPFKEQEAAQMHQDVSTQHGTAGPVFIRQLISQDRKEIVKQYNDICNTLSALSGGKNGAHISDVAVVALADALVDSWIFNDSPEILSESIARAIEMANEIFQDQLATGVADVNETAKQFVVDWIMSNKDYFGERAMGTCLGKINNGIVYIFPSLFNQALQKAGFSPRKTLRYLADEGLITVTTSKSGTKVYSNVSWFDHQSCRFVEFHLYKIRKTIDPLEDEEEAAKYYAQDGDLPFGEEGSNEET